MKTTIIHLMCLGAFFLTQSIEASEATPADALPTAAPAPALAIVVTGDDEHHAPALQSLTEDTALPAQLVEDAGAILDAAAATTVLSEPVVAPKKTMKDYFAKFSIDTFMKKHKVKSKAAAKVAAKKAKKEEAAKPTVALAPSDVQPQASASTPPGQGQPDAATPDQDASKAGAVVTAGPRVPDTKAPVVTPPTPPLKEAVEQSWTENPAFVIPSAVVAASVATFVVLATYKWSKRQTAAAIAK